MIWTVMAVCIRRLLHNRTELLLTIVVPIVFFSIFAVIFGGASGAGKTPEIKVAVVDAVGSAHSRRVTASLRQARGLLFVDRSGNAAAEGADELAMSEREAASLVRRGSAALAIVLRGGEGGSVRAELLSDASDQVAPQVAAALVQRVLLLTGPVTPTPGQVQPAVASRPSVPAVVQAGGAGGDEARPPALPLAVPAVQSATVQVIDIIGGDRHNPVISMYAAGIAVMFLLFGASGGGGALLEERENQTLDRLLTTGLTMDQLLLGKWCYLTLLGVVQTTIMFVWGQAVFGIDLLGHLDGFLMMTSVTAGAAAAFGLLLATLCRTRGQLNGLSIVAVLSMSALGGSMVPRYVMSQSLRDAGLWTFNAWALDGYDKVFWRQLPVAELWPQMSVLMLSGAVFLVTARGLATRWETQ